MHKYKTHVTYKASQTRRKMPEDIIAALLSKNFPSSPGSRPITIAIGGPGGTGKSTFAKKLAALIPDSAIMRLDDYKTPRAHRAGKNIFGAHPDANMMDLIAEHISLIKQNTPFDKPLYDNVTGTADKTETYTPTKFNILDGEISTYRKFRDNIDFSIFIDSDWKTQLATRTSRDVESRGYTREKAIETFLQSNLREFTKYGAESKNWADIHLYCSRDHSLAIESVASELYEHFEDLLAQHLATVDLSGLVVPVTTPFDADYKIDRRMYVEHLELLASQGVKRIMVNGTTAEFFSLTDDERKLMFNLSREYFPGVIIFHAGTDGITRTISQAKWAQDYGADAIVAIAPYYLASLSAGGIVDYFNAVAQCLEIPFILYNFPKHTQNPLTPEILAKINHFGMKDSAGDLSLIGATSHYYIGGDEKILTAYQQGAYGFVSARANAFARLFVQMENAIAENDNSAAPVQARITELKKEMTSSNAIAKLKYAISKQLPGYPTRLRLPLIELSQQEQQAMSEIVKKYA